MNKVKFGNGTLLVGMWIVLALWLFPIFWTFITSIKPLGDMFAMPPKWIFTPSFQGYSSVVGQTHFQHYFINSLIISSIVAVGSVVISLGAAYGLNRYRFKYSGNLGSYILSTRIAPPMVVAVPFYLISRKLGLFDSHILLILIYLCTNLSFSVWILQGYLRRIPVELDEAALVEGCTRWQILLKVIMPNLSPGLIATGIMSFIFSWNEFFFASLLTGTNSKTLPVGVAGYFSMEGMRWDEITAAGIIATLPMLIFGLLVHKRFVEGLLGGALKE